MKDVLILGSDGKLGSGLMKKLEFRARGTTRRTDLLPNEIFLNLLDHESIQNLKNESDYRFAIIVAAISDPDQCFVNQELSNLINVESTIKVLKILSENQIPYLLEVNTQPGLTSTSLLPEQASYLGISFVNLCLIMLSLSNYKSIS